MSLVCAPFIRDSLCSRDLGVTGGAARSHGEQPK